MGTVSAAVVESMGTVSAATVRIWPQGMLRNSLPATDHTYLPHHPLPHHRLRTASLPNSSASVPDELQPVRPRGRCGPAGCHQLGVRPVLGHCASPSMA